MREVPPPGATPVLLRVARVLRDASAGSVGWDVARLASLVAYYQQHVDVEEVAVACADWLASGKAKRVSDGPATYRTFLERAKQAQDSRLASTPTQTQRALGEYDRWLR